MMDYEPNEAWIDAMASVINNPYKPCPCGCGTKWRFVLKSGKLEEHERKFREDYDRENKTEAGAAAV